MTVFDTRYAKIDYLSNEFTKFSSNPNNPFTVSINTISMDKITNLNSTISSLTTSINNCYTKSQIDSGFATVAQLNAVTKYNYSSAFTTTLTQVNGTPNIYVELGPILYNQLSSEVQSLIDSKQNYLTIRGNDTSSFKLINSNVVRGLIAGNNITLSQSNNDITIAIDLSSYVTSSTLTSSLATKNNTITNNGDDTNGNGYKLINNNISRSLKPGNNITITQVSDALTINGPDLSNYVTTGSLACYIRNILYTKYNRYIICKIIL
jgi:hypothetical protein